MQVGGRLVMVFPSLFRHGFVSNREMKDQTELMK